MTIEIDEAIEMYTSNAEYERTHGSLQGCLDFKQLAEWLRDYKRLKEQEPSGDLISKQTVLDTISELNAISFYEAQEDSKECYYEIRQAIKDLPPVKQEPKTEKVIKMRDATHEEQKSVNDYIKSISKPTGIEFDIDIDKKVESYGKLLKHPVVKHIMNEEQEQLDFVQPHKRIPVTLTVSGDLISRQEAIDTIRQLYIDLAIQKYVIDILKALPSVKPQESMTGHWILKIEDWNKWTCSECGHSERTDIHVSLEYDFCPKCGARMEQEPCDVPDINDGKMSENPTGSESEE